LKRNGRTELSRSRKKGPPQRRNESVYNLVSSFLANHTSPFHDTYDIINSLLLCPHHRSKNVASAIIPIHGPMAADQT
jgi:hypothetical protein